MARLKQATAAPDRTVGLSRRVRLWLAVFVLLGLGASAAAAYAHYRLLYDPGYTSVCDIGPSLSCTAVYSSRYGSVAGVSVALIGVLWFAATLVLLLAERYGPAELRHNVPGYLFAWSTAGLAAVFYFGYASFVVLKTVCAFCLVVYVAVIGLFLLSGAATPFSVTTIPGRLWSDLRRLARAPASMGVGLLFVVAAGSAIAFFPRDVARHETAAQEPPAAPSAALAQFEAWWRTQPRVQVPVPAEGAKVLVVKFNDYQCPPCRQTYYWYQPIFAKYERLAPGAVRVVTRDFPLDPECNQFVPGGTHMAACEAAVAVRLARRRQTAERLEAWLFANQEALSPARVKEAAREVAGVTDFDAQYARVLEEVKADIALGRLLGVEATPTFFINGVKVRGGLQAAYFDAAIDLELKRAR